MFFCLIQKPHPVRRPPLCRRGAGGEAVPQERENQINTLVLKDINFTINIIELSYYRTIDTLNQSKNAPVAHFISLKVGTDALVCPKHPNHWERTDEGVCPYVVENENAYPN